jgi:hypothetical protein
MITRRIVTRASMRAKALATILALFSLAICLIPAPASADALSLNPTTGTISTEVAIPGPSNYGKGNYYIYWDTSTQLLSQGTIGDNTPAIGFVVPETNRGKHMVILKIGEDTYQRDFTVQPSLSISPDQGAVGTSITVVGKGFDSSESVITVTYDGIPVQTQVRASSKGSWQSTFKVPQSSRGEHSIDAGGSTPATDVPDQTFTVNPQIDTDPSSGWVGKLVSIAGSGFDIGETNITVTYDDLLVKGGITADAKGSWQSSFSVPTSAKGAHMIDAYGATTTAVQVADVIFTISPGIKLELVAGYLGGAVHPADSIWVSGFGFEANEAGIQVTFDGNMVASSIIADAKGSWSTQVEVPPTTKGEHKIGASGETTKAADLTAATVVISPTIEISPTEGAAGDEIVINGTGFGQKQVITISYDGNQVTTSSTIATDTKGSFTASIRVPRGKSGKRTITVTDSGASVASASLTVESNPPPTPKPIAPEASSKLGSTFGKTAITFKWSAVEDPSGVYYTLEVSNSADFSGALVHKEDLTEPQYTLSQDESLGAGEYYWRVRAVDGADNKSDWTNGQYFKVGGMEWWLILLIAIVAVVLIAIIGRLMSMRSHRSWR